MAALPVCAAICFLLDLGATCGRCTQLLEFGESSGSEAASEILGRTGRRVALLNIGTEVNKGRYVREAAQLLAIASGELHWLYRRATGCLWRCDVVVCDGLSVGNGGWPQRSEGLAAIWQGEYVMPGRQLAVALAGHPFCGGGAQR